MASKIIYNTNGNKYFSTGQNCTGASWLCSRQIANINPPLADRLVEMDGRAILFSNCQ